MRGFRPGDSGSPQYLRGQKQQQRIVWRALKPEPLVEPHSLRINGIDKQTHTAGYNLDALRSAQRVDEQEIAQTFSVMARIDRQAAQAHARNAVRQLLAQSFGQMAAFEFGQDQGVVAADLRRRLLQRGNEGFGQALVLVLARDLAQPRVQRFAAAVETLAVMAASQSGDLQRCGGLFGSA